MRRVDILVDKRCTASPPRVTIEGVVVLPDDKWTLTACPNVGVLVCVERPALSFPEKISDVSDRAFGGGPVALVRRRREPFGVVRQRPSLNERKLFVMRVVPVSEDRVLVHAPVDGVGDFLLLVQCERGARLPRRVTACGPPKAHLDGCRQRVLLLSSPPTSLFVVVKPIKLGKDAAMNFGQLGIDQGRRIARRFSSRNLSPRLVVSDDSR